MFTPWFVYAADIHLQDGAWAKRPEIHGDARCSFRQLIDYCVQQQLPLCLGGDNLDKQSQASPDNLMVLARGAAELLAIGIDIAFIQGDHCTIHGGRPGSQPWPLAAGVNVQHLPAMVDGAVFYGRSSTPDVVRGLDWTPAHELKAALAAVPPCSILITHQAWAEVQRIGNVEGSLADIPFPCVVLSGDYHRTTELTVGNVRFYSPGSTCMQAIDEPPNKAFFVVGHEHGQIVVQTHPLLTRPFHHLIVNTAEDLASLPQILDTLLLAELQLNASLSLGAGAMTPLLRVTYLESIPGVRESVERICQNHVHYFWNPKTVLDTVVVDYEAASERQAFNSLLAAIEELSPRQDVSDGLDRLLRTARPLADELDAMKAEALQ